MARRKEPTMAEEIAALDRWLLLGGTYAEFINRHRTGMTEADLLRRTIRRLGA